MTSRSDFGGKTEGKEVASAFANEIKGKTILITGVSPKGLGEALARTLAAQNPKHLILTGRSIDKVEVVTKDLASTYPDIETRILKLDIASFESIRAASAVFNSYPENIDILFNNAGVMNIPERILSTDGFEMHLATNYLGLFLFTNGIMGKLLSGGGARIVNINSKAIARTVRVAGVGNVGNNDLHKPITLSDLPGPHLF